MKIRAEWTTNKYREEIVMNKDVMKDVFLHGETHADMSRFLIDCKEPVLSYDNSSLYESMVIAD